MIDLKTLSERVKFLIEKLSLEPENQGFNQTILAEKCGMSKSLLSQYLIAKLPIGAKPLVKIAKELDCSPKWLKSGEGNWDTSFNDYLFDDCKKNPSAPYKTIRLERYSKDIFELKFLVRKDEMINIFETYQKNT